MILNLKRIGGHDLPLPSRGSEDAAGFDLRAELSRTGANVILRVGFGVVIPTGFAWEIPTGFVGFVCSRSGLAAKLSVFVANAPGIIDSDFRDAVSVILYNGGNENFTICHGDRIAQMVIQNQPRFSLVEIEALNETARGVGGLGSTGVK